MLIAGLVTAYVAAERLQPMEAGAAHRHRWFAVGGIALLWVALDWPLGPLGASYLASVHMVQYLIIGLAAPGLLLLGLPAQTFDAIRARGRLERFLRSATHPGIAFFLFNVIMTASHWPRVVDGMMATQLGSFALDMSWLLAGLVFWWPVVCPVPEWRRFTPLFKIGYLALNAIVIRPPFALLLFSEYPVYKTYELAPPIGTINALDDQQLAGGLMKIGSAWIMAVGVAVLMYQLYRRNQGVERGNPLG